MESHYTRGECRLIEPIGSHNLGTEFRDAHIYEPSYSLLKAYRDILHHMEIIYEISEMNLALGYKTVPLKKFASGIIRVATL